jgi:hypothetical protein
MHDEVLGYFPVPLGVPSTLFMLYGVANYFNQVSYFDEQFVDKIHHGPRYIKNLGLHFCFCIPKVSLE